MLYVDLNSTNPSPPYASWATAALQIQDAIEIASANDEIRVNDGIYAKGGQLLPGSPTNRVALTKPLLLKSVHGPAVTIIQGYQVGGTLLGIESVRCAYLGDAATLSGFTLTSGATLGEGGSSLQENGGGVYCESSSAVVSNCVIVGNAASSGGGIWNGTIRDCTISNNAAINGPGGGAYSSLLTGCTIISNSAANFGGGAELCTLLNCSLVANAAMNNGGAADQCSLTNCFLSRNTADTGGGATLSTLVGCKLSTNAVSNAGGAAEGCLLQRCVLLGNSADQGGGAMGSSLVSCALAGNSAKFGGGAANADLQNCTLVGNSASLGGGGSSSGDANNCILYDNLSPSGSNYLGTHLTNCCTSPLPEEGIGNFTNAPLFIDAPTGNLRLQINSPCINSGLNSQVSSLTDLDGRPRIVGSIVDVGAYEFQGPDIGFFTAWLEQFHLPTDGSADYVDSDGEGLNNWQEWRCGTIPTNATSALRLVTPATAPQGLLISWQSVTNHFYLLERSTNLVAQPPFQPIASGISGQEGITTYHDVSAVGPGPFYYRVSVP